MSVLHTALQAVGTRCADGRVGLMLSKCDIAWRLSSKISLLQLLPLHTGPPLTRDGRRRDRASRNCPIAWKVKMNAGVQACGKLAIQTQDTRFAMQSLLCSLCSDPPIAVVSSIIRSKKICKLQIWVPKLA